MAERGGTLVLVAGKRSLPLAYAGQPNAANDPFLKMLPIREPRVFERKDGFTLSLTPEGKRGRSCNSIPARGPPPGRICPRITGRSSARGNPARLCSRPRRAMKLRLTMRPVCSCSRAMALAKFCLSASTAPGDGVTRPATLITIDSGANSCAGPRPRDCCPPAIVSALRHARAGQHRAGGRVWRPGSATKRRHGCCPQPCHQSPARKAERTQEEAAVVPLQANAAQAKLLEGKLRDLPAGAIVSTRPPTPPTALSPAMRASRCVPEETPRCSIFRPTGNCCKDWRRRVRDGCSRRKTLSRYWIACPEGAATRVRPDSKPWQDEPLVWSGRREFSLACWGWSGFGGTSRSASDFIRRLP